MKNNLGQLYSKKSLNILFICTIFILLLEYLNTFTINHPLLQIILFIVFLLFASLSILIQLINNKYEIVIENLNKKLIKKVTIKDKSTIVDGSLSNGRLAILLAKTYKRTSIIGYDNYNYRKDITLDKCKENIKNAKVSKHITITDNITNTIDTLLSSNIIKKAPYDLLKHLSKKGQFAFIDINDNPDQLINELKKEYTSVKYIPYEELKNDMPFYMRNKLGLKNIIIIYGKR